MTLLCPPGGSSSPMDKSCFIRPTIFFSALIFYPTIHAAFNGDQAEVDIGSITHSLWRVALWQPHLKPKPPGPLIARKNFLKALKKIRCDRWSQILSWELKCIPISQLDVQRSSLHKDMHWKKFAKVNEKFFLNVPKSWNCDWKKAKLKEFTNWKAYYL